MNIADVSGRPVGKAQNGTDAPSGIMEMLLQSTVQEQQRNTIVSALIGHQAVIHNMVTNSPGDSFLSAVNITDPSCRVNTASPTIIPAELRYASPHVDDSLPLVTTDFTDHDYCMRMCTVFAPTASVCDSSAYFVSSDVLQMVLNGHIETFPIWRYETEKAVGEDTTTLPVGGNSDDRIQGHPNDPLRNEMEKEPVVNIIGDEVDILPNDQRQWRERESISRWSRRSRSPGDQLVAHIFKGTPARRRSAKKDEWLDNNPDIFVRYAMEAIVSTVEATESYGLHAFDSDDLLCGYSYALARIRLNDEDSKLYYQHYYQARRNDPIWKSQRNAKLRLKMATEEEKEKKRIRRLWRKENDPDWWRMEQQRLRKYAVLRMIQRRTNPGKKFGPWKKQGRKRMDGLLSVSEESEKGSEEDMMDEDENDPDYRPK